MTGREQALGQLGSGRIVALVLLVIGIGLVEVGVRPVPHQPSAQVALPLPHILRSPVEQLRGMPGRAVDNPRIRSVVEGVVFGRAEDVDEADIDAFRSSGLLHLLAASGQNIALVAGMAIAFVLLLGGSRMHGALLALAAMPAYTLVVGGGPSIVRACVMGEIALLSWVLGRCSDVWHATFVSAACIVWIWPGSHRALGFQLSYACVISLLAVAPRLATTCERYLRWRPLALAVSATMSCSIASAPILLMRVGEAPAAGIVVNLAAVPVASVVLVTGLIGSITAVLVPGIESLLLAPAASGSSILLMLAHEGASMPMASTSSWLIGVVLPALSVAAVSTRSRNIRGIAAIGLAGATLIASAGVIHEYQSRPGPPGAGVTRLAVLDIGQGDATLIQQRRSALLIDTGPPDGNAVRELRKLSVARVDGIIVTHDSLDHRGGLRTLVRAMRPRWIAYPFRSAGDWSWVRKLGPEVRNICAGSVIALEKAQLQILHPPCTGDIPTVTTDAHNDAAAVTMLVAGTRRMLIPADAEAPVLNRLDLPHIDVLRISHHGSADPDLSELLDTTTPLATVISAGAGNAYGHPRPDTLATIRAAHVPVWRTDRNGTTVFETDGRQLWQRQ